MSSYKIREIEILTGIKAHTLRVWEKRYNLLTPSRTETKIRTYSDQDLKDLLNIAVLYGVGWKISKIAFLDKNEINDLVKKETQSVASSSSTVNLLIQSLIDNDNIQFEDILDQTIEKVGFYSTYIDYILPFLSRIGILWSTGNISISQEHFTSNIIRQKLISAIDRLEINKKNLIDFMLFSPEGEFHELSLLFYHFALKKMGARVFYLGVNVPESDLIKAIESVQPKHLVTSIILAKDIQAVSAYFNRLKELNLPIYAGGSFIENSDLIKNGSLKSVHSLFSV